MRHSSEDAAQDLATAQADVAERARRIGAEHPSLDVEAAAVRGEPGDVLADRSGDDVLVVVGAENAHTEEYSHSRAWARDWPARPTGPSRSFRSAIPSRGPA